VFDALGSTTYRWRYLIVAAWLLAMAASARFAPSLAGQAASDQAAFLPPDTPSMQADAALGRAFPGATAASSATLTFSRATGLTDADRAYVDATAAWVGSAEAPADLRDAVTETASARSRPELAAMLRSADGQLELLLVDLSVSSAGDAASAVVAELRAHAASTAPSGLAVHVTGTAGITSDYLEAVKAGTDSTTAVTIVLVLAILLLIYRAPLAALVPLATIGGAYVVSRGVLGVLAASGWKITSLLDTFLVVMVFGVGTDYAIFLISRFREEVGRGDDWHAASRDTVRRIGAVISASAATVIVGLGAMAFGDFEMIKSTGPALGVAIFVTLVAGLTLTPALLGIFGRHLFWPLHARPAAEGEPRGFFARLAAAVGHHPGLVTILIVGLLGLPALYMPQMHTNFDTLAELPESSDARQGFDVVAAHLGKGKLVQSTGLISSPGGDMLAPAQLARFRDTVLALQRTAGVANVTSLVTPDGDGVVPDGFRPSVQLKTIGDAFSPDSSSSSSSSGAASGSSTSLLDPKLSDGLDSALNYIAAVGTGYPDVAGRAEFRAARGSVTAAQDLVARVRRQTVVSTQLRTLAAALTAPATAAGGGGDDSALMARYLEELAGAFPEVRGLPAFRDAARAASSLAASPTATAAVDTADAMDRLAVHFDGRPDAHLSPTSLAGTASALELKSEVTATFAAIPKALDSLAAVFSGRSDDILVPLGLGGDTAADLGRAVGAFVSADRASMRFYVTGADDPYAPESFAMVRDAQAMLAAAAPGFGAGASAHLGGPTAQFADVQTTLEADFGRVGVITVLGIFLVLVLLLRAIVAPLYLVATVLLSYTSAVGLSAFLFQEVLHHTGISFYLPLMVFVLLVALGSDYNIFLMSRVREESESRPIRDGIRIASGHTGAVITSAGLILAGTFGSMASAPLVVLFQVGVAVAIGVLIDTFVVRSVLVPALTTLAGERAWWPSGLRPGALVPAVAGGLGLGGGSLGDAALGGGPEPGGSAPAVASVSADAAAPGHAVDGRLARRSLARTAVAVGLAVLVPVTFAGLVTWAWQPRAGALSVSAAVVNADEGTTVTAGDGSSARLNLGRDLSAGLAEGGAGGPGTAGSAVSWTATDAATAASGLASGAYAAVLTIPSDFSRSIAAIRAGTTASAPQATLGLQTAEGGDIARAVALSVSDTIARTATRDATASYVEDVLLAVSTARSAMSATASSARGVSGSATALSGAASGTSAVAGALVTGLGTLASGVAVSADGTRALADGTAKLASGLSSLASGASSLASGAGRAADGASSLASGASSLADGLAQARAQTAPLPATTAQLADGAAGVATGAAQTAAGAAALSAGLGSLAQGTAGLGAQADQLNTGAAGLAAGAHDLAAGASAAATGAAGLSAGAASLRDGVGAYTAGVDALAADCASLGGGAAVCAALSGLAGGSDSLRGAASQVATGASGVAAAASGVASGAATTSAGAAGLHAGTAQLAAGAPGIETGIADSANGAAALAGGASQVADGATQVASGTGQLAAGMPALADGIAALASGASGVSSGAAALSQGVGELASGADGLASGSRASAAGAAAIADGTRSAATGAGQLSDALGQALGGARIVQAQTGQLSAGGTSLAGQASKVSDELTSLSGALPPDGAADRAQVAARIADPVAVQATPGDTAGGGIAPLAIALALWAGALVALLAVPLPGRGRRPWGRRLAGVALAGGVGLVAAALMVAGLRLGVGLEVARLPLLLGVSLLAAAAFAAVAGALVAAFGLRGWVAALLAAALGIAVSGYPFGTDALPGLLAAVRPLLPTSWAIDASRSAIASASSPVATDVAGLAVWLILGVLAVAAVSAGRARRLGAIASR